MLSVPFVPIQTNLLLAKVNKGKKAPVIVSSVFDTDQIQEYRKPVLCIFDEPVPEEHLQRLTELETANAGVNPLSRPFNDS